MTDFYFLLECPLNWRVGANSPKLVPHHEFSYIHRDEFISVVHRKRVAYKIRSDR